eukprot:scaffold31391_cov75-Cyclotella_meneghiniana.AAC.9
MDANNAMHAASFIPSLSDLATDAYLYMNPLPLFMVGPSSDQFQKATELSRLLSTPKGQVGGAHDPKDDGGGDSEGDDDDKDEDDIPDDDRRELYDEEYESIDGMEVKSKTPYCLVDFASALKSFKTITEWMCSRLRICNEAMHKHSSDVQTIGAEINIGPG